MIGLFALGPLQMRIPDYAHVHLRRSMRWQTTEYNYIIWFYNYDVFFLTYLEKNFTKKFKQKLRHQVEAEALSVEAEAIKKLLLPHRNVRMLCKLDSI